MSREIPEPIRAAAGLAVTVLDEARRLPSTLTGLPVRLVGLALQTAMKFQQQWSGLVARGDEVLTGLRGESEPGMATFDEDEEDAGGAALVAEPIDVLRTSAFDRAPDVDTTGITDDEVAALPGDPAADAVVAAVEDTAAALDDTDARIGDTEVVLTEVDVMEVDVDTDAAGLVDDEAAGLPPDPSPAEVVAAVESITDQVQGAEEAEVALQAADTGLTTEDALESALLEAEGTPETAGDTTEQDTPAASDPGGSPVGELAGAPDVGSDDTTIPDAADSGTADTDIGRADTDTTGADAGVLGEDAQSGTTTDDAATEVDVITPDGEVATVEGTVTDEGVVAPEDADAATTAEDTTTEAAEADATATGGGSDVVTDEHARVDEQMGAEPDAADSGGGTTTADTTSTTADTTVETTGDTVTEGGSDVVTDDHARVDEQMGAEPAAAEGAGPTDTATDTATGEAAVEATDEGGTPVAAATGVPADAGGADTADEDTAGVESPIDGYDSFTIAQLRGRLRGYQLATVQDLLAYEEATRARPQFVTMLRNRLEKLEQQAADASPLQPRG
ncbi:hypothetical protein JOD57_003320 [Geodermatophilus bullaregiensis]|uniref:hypothetical protein n=1 Tax=Geodermatophilus bullaregiensis TaxID=1564160 RepID=UPI00195A16FA|nr:hypothetical protein [Geodermatophilus bullaregiensis]MBM7807483.1 hypothetical protein [Geodermatophilus bullaregiensis]